MLVLFETPAGFALFKVNDDKKIQKTDNLFQEFSSVEGAQKLYVISNIFPIYLSRP
jgi:nucleolar protein 58